MKIGMLVAALLISSLFSLVAQDFSSAKPYDVDEAYQIYSLVFPNEESYGLGKGTLVIQEDTVSQPLDSACFDPKSASRFKDALADFSYVQKRTRLLQRQFQIEKPYELVSSDTINLFFKEHGVDGWQRFYKRYPDSGGFIIMSPVGFNKTKTLAVVYTGSSCGVAMWAMAIPFAGEDQWQVEGSTWCYLQNSVLADEIMRLRSSSLRRGT